MPQGRHAMDGSRFDALARTVGRLTTRRGSFRLVSGAVVALGTGARFLGAGAKRRDCRLVDEPCGKDAGKPGRCCTGAVCAEGPFGGAVCVCPEPLQICNGLCVDRGADPRGCGPNCEVCAAESDCCSGECCKDGQRCCDGKCTDLTADNANCGGCGQTCPDGTTCCDSRCRAFADDPRHCGGCGKQCGAHAVCANSQCVCRKGYADCGDGVCRFLQNDPRNCGRCGRACGRGQRCSRGRCKCAPGFPTACLPGDVFRCGIAEDRPCAGPEECCGGHCLFYGGEDRCRPCLGAFCRDHADCCGGVSCLESPGPPAAGRFCGGCRGRREPCISGEQCCSTECTPDRLGSTCLSSGGGRCRSDLDCRDCFVNGNCDGACAGGRCRS